MDTLLSMKVFCQVVHSGSFTRATEQLDISVPMASKHVAHLERSLNARLLYRNNRRLSLTEQGEAYYRDCLAALDMLEQAAARAAGSTARPQGRLRVSIPVWFANPVFAGWMSEYRQRYPEVSLQLTLTNHSVNLDGDGEDIALRLSKQPAENLIARTLAEIEFYLVAAPAYLAAHGTPAAPQDLAAHQAILPSYTDVSSLPLRRAGETHTAELQAAVYSNNTQMIYQMVCAGAGVGYLPEWLLRADLQTGRLRRLLPDYQTAPMPFYAVYTQRKLLSAKVRSFIDFMVEKAGMEAG
ncbi:LysR family transcriptional regulator [Eikenella sp. S3360]|uniref:LysR family transcriptional regulator n=1 Tax=Eikenella glucosivorans TaxID=2766967 RepID=A0ABS0N956_9NEIS|nr:LysR family transcriptional regulator [Eikenella glucosivorans]MBH5328836.1 LysR family transcriptional regulator [Eikenella glucosivorans]